MRLFITPSYAFPISEYQYSYLPCIYSFMTLEPWRSLSHSVDIAKMLLV